MSDDYSGPDKRRAATGPTATAPCVSLSGDRELSDRDRRKGIIGPFEALNQRVEKLEAEVAWLKRIISELETGCAELLRGPNGVR